MPDWRRSIEAKAWMANYSWEGSFPVLAPSPPAARLSEPLHSFADRTEWVTSERTWQSIGQPCGLARPRARERYIL